MVSNGVLQLLLTFVATLGLASVNNASAATTDTNTTIQQTQTTDQTNNSFKEATTVKGNTERNITDSPTNKDQTTDKFKNKVTNVDQSQAKLMVNKVLKKLLISQMKIRPHKQLIGRKILITNGYIVVKIVKM